LRGECLKRAKNGYKLSRVGSILPIATEHEFWDAGEGDAANNCYSANPGPSGRPKRQKPNTVSEGNNSTKDEKRAREAAVNSAAAE
jgi:hypothetical protein